MTHTGRRHGPWTPSRLIRPASRTISSPTSPGRGRPGLAATAARPGEPNPHPRARPAGATDGIGRWSWRTACTSESPSRRDRRRLPETHAGRTNAPGRPRPRSAAPSERCGDASAARTGQAAMRPHWRAAGTPGGGPVRPRPPRSACAGQPAAVGKASPPARRPSRRGAPAARRKCSPEARQQSDLHSAPARVERPSVPPPDQRANPEPVSMQQA